MVFGDSNTFFVGGGSIMKKKYLILLVMLMMTNISFADDATNVLNAIDKTNVKIENEIEKAVSKSFEETSLEKINTIIVKLLDKTNDMSAKMVEKAAESGIVVVCDWVPVEINGEIIMVDPLRVFSIHRVN